MTISQPFYRIIRFDKNNPNTPYVEHGKYGNDKFRFINAYKIIEEDLKEVLEYVDSSDKNLRTYSHQLFLLLLKSATEFETNCKRILDSNGYTKKDNLDTKDYFKINSATMLSKYELRLKIWYPKEKTIRPLKEWDKSHSLKWYQSYNDVKHDRSARFEEANLKNTLNAIGGLFCIIFSQFGAQTFNPYNEQYSFNIDNNGFTHSDNSLFSIKPYTNWKKGERYDFDWYKIRKDKDPFQRYIF